MLYQVSAEQYSVLGRCPNSKTVSQREHNTRKSVPTAIQSHKENITHTGVRWEMESFVEPNETDNYVLKAVA